ncbi:MAG: prolipoprotein diacylglyceryl transferase [Clostridia bacterium]|nr:prolipoprotein diacylglyceryl transferase [Clostridia bacterium]
MLSHVSSGFSIFGLEISYYGLLMGIAFLVAISIAVFNAKKRGMTTDDILLLAIYIIPLSILGARTYFCIFSGNTYTFLQFFEIWNGGLAILGGVIGGVIAIVLYCLIHKKNFLQILDIAAPSLIIGQAIGRIGCFFAGCCYGIEVTNPSLHFFPVSIQIDGVWHFATMFWESAFCILGFVALQLFFKRKPPKGAVACAYMCIYGVWRAIVETFRGDSLMFFETGLKVSQVLSILLVIGGIIGLILIYTKHKKNETVNHS